VFGLGWGLLGLAHGGAVLLLVGGHCEEGCREGSS
jgi:hypothetical protein